MGRTCRRFTPGFKDEAVKLVINTNHPHGLALRGFEVWLLRLDQARPLGSFTAPRAHRSQGGPVTWRVANTTTSDFCVAALAEALALYGTPEIFNTDQGSQFTSEALTSMLLEAGVAISMDGVGRAIDNVFVERLWRTLKYDTSI
jgi:transposase InsO family protein